eukprot:2331128-Rhodomonas_salina.1
MGAPSRARPARGPGPRQVVCSVAPYSLHLYLPSACSVAPCSSHPLPPYCLLRSSLQLAPLPP